MKTLLKKYRKTNLILLISLVSAFFTIIGVSCEKPIEIDYREKFVGKYYAEYRSMGEHYGNEIYQYGEIEIILDKDSDSTIIFTGRGKIKIDINGYFPINGSFVYSYGLADGDNIIIINYRTTSAHGMTFYGTSVAKYKKIKVCNGL